MERAAKFPRKQLIQPTPKTQAAKKLLGKDESAMSILNGTNMLSTVIRRDEFYRTLRRNSEDVAVARAARIKELIDQGFNAEEVIKKSTYTNFNTRRVNKSYWCADRDYRRIGTISQEEKKD